MLIVMKAVSVENLRASPATEISKVEHSNLLKLDENLDPNLFIEALKHERRNRFPNILPNGPTRFKIEADPTFYFNANWVLEGRAIACQGPLPWEIDEFWRMAWEANVNTVVMLANPIEKGAHKCCKYWKKFKHTKKTIVSYGKERIVKRKIEVIRGNETRIFVQYHLKNWPDFKTVLPQTLGELVTLVAKRGGRILAHCSAGVGRTGTFLAAFEAFRKRTTAIYPIVLALRNPMTGRVGSVQTPDQYRLVLKTAELLKKT
jgi:protein tyrosine phosphatase